MVDRDFYKNDVDFAALALRFPDFNKHLRTNGQLDFSNPEAIQQLTKSLLKRDFGLEVELPSDRLCPPVPNRYNYVIWIQDLIDSTSKSFQEKYEEDREVIGLDIGTGASSIYALLGCAMRPRWKFAVTDIDAKNMSCAKHNVLKNNLKSRVYPLQTTQNDPLVQLSRIGLSVIDFTICNPPFYSSANDLLASAKAKARPPHSACTGADVEMVTEGGEVAFVSRLIEGSKKLREQCQWYTSMLGKASSVEAIVHKIRDAGIQNWAVKDLVQGNKTKRWVVGWSWGRLRPTEAIARATTTLPKHLLPFPSEYEFHSTNANLEATARKLDDTMKGLHLRWIYKPALATGVAFAGSNVWSRAARRKRERGSPLAEDDQSSEQPALIVKIRLGAGQENSATVKIRWLSGEDVVLFESFCGMLKRQITTTDDS